MAEAPPRFAPLRRPDGTLNVKRLGVPRDAWRDVYYSILVQSWARFYLVLVGFYVSANCIFATLYWVQPGSVGDARAGHWLDDFFFSFETMATVGYGVMHPVTLYAHWLVIVEILFGVLAIPLATGLTILKFARPSARVTFSRNVLVSHYDGVPTLMFRLANIRTNEIYEARINLTLLRREVTAEGRAIRRLVDLKLVRDTNPMFVLSWSVMHRLEADSPLFGVDFGAVAAGDLAFLAVMTGLDATASATVHARHSYEIGDVLVGHFFEDIIRADPDGVISIDYGKLHAVRRVDAEPAG